MSCLQLRVCRAGAFHTSSHSPHGRAAAPGAFQAARRDSCVAPDLPGQPPPPPQGPDDGDDDRGFRDTMNGIFNSLMLLRNMNASFDTRRGRTLPTIVGGPNLGDFVGDAGMDSVLERLMATYEPPVQPADRATVQRLPRFTVGQPGASNSLPPEGGASGDGSSGKTHTQLSCLAPVLTLGPCCCLCALFRWLRGPLHRGDLPGVPLRVRSGGRGAGPTLLPQLPRGVCQVSRG